MDARVGSAPAEVAPPPPHDLSARQAALTVAALCLGGVAVRALTSALLPSVVWADETFQSVEQALRLLTGRGMTPWEFQIGARSWILPGLAAPLIAAGRALSADPRVAFAFIAALMIALSAVNVWSAYVIGAQTGRRLCGVFAAGLAAFWCELVYYSPHLLPDTLSGALLLAALAVATRPDRDGRLFWAGVLLGATLVVRVQLAPAIGLIGLVTCFQAGWLRARWVAAGFVLPVAALGALDWLTWGAPFRSVLVYLRTNTSGLAEYFGVSPAVAYVGTEKLVWAAATPLIVATVVLGAKRARTTTLAALVILLTFSAVAHKEQRFVYPALLLMFTVCGIGTVELADEIRRHVRARAVRAVVPFALALLWVAASLASGFGSTMRPLWTRDADVLAAFDVVNADTRSCGVGLDYPDWTKAGLSRLRDDVQLYDAGEAPAGAYDYLLRLPGPHRPLALYQAQGFRLEQCYGAAGVCLYRRDGGCEAGAPPLRATTAGPVRASLRRLGLEAY